MDSLLDITALCTDLKCSELAKTIKRRVTVVTLLPKVPHTVTGFIILCQTGWHENERRQGTDVSTSIFCNTPHQPGNFPAKSSQLSSFISVTGGEIKWTILWFKIVLQLGFFQNKRSFYGLTFKNNISLSFCWIISTESSNCLKSFHVLINNSSSCMNAAGCCCLSWFMQPREEHLLMCSCDSRRKRRHFCLAGPYHRQLNTWLFGVEHTSRFY